MNKKIAIKSINLNKKANNTKPLISLLRSWLKALAFFSFPQFTVASFNEDVVSPTFQSIDRVNHVAAHRLPNIDTDICHPDGIECERGNLIHFDCHTPVQTIEIDKRWVDAAKKLNYEDVYKRVLKGDTYPDYMADYRTPEFNRLKRIVPFRKILHSVIPQLKKNYNITSILVTIGTKNNIPHYHPAETYRNEPFLFTITFDQGSSTKFLGTKGYACESNEIFGNQLDSLHESDTWKSADNDNEVLGTLFALACPQKASEEFKEPPLKMFFHLAPK